MARSGDSSTLERGRTRHPQMPHRRTPPGTAPGTLVADPEALEPQIRLIAYGPDRIEEKDIASIDDIPAADALPVTWVNVDGLGDTGLIDRFGERFGLHRLALEDVIHVHQRPKVEDYDDHLFIVFRMVDADSRGHSEQVALFLGADFVITFQERLGDSFEPVRARLRAGRGVIRRSGSDYLAYALIDAALDRYFPVLEAYDDVLEDLTEGALHRPDPSLVAELHQVKRELFHHRRNVWSSREMLNTLLRDDHPVIRTESHPYIRDCYDHCIQLMDILEMQREVAAGLFDIYLSSLSTRLNEIMKTLTLIATIFIPLTFITGIYGMNFDPKESPWNMPELQWTYGYPFALGLMAVVALGLFLWFRRRGWIAGSPRRGLRRRSPLRRAPRRAPSGGVESGSRRD